MLQGKTPILIALVLGGLAFILAYAGIKKREADITAGWAPVEVLVARVDIPEGALITEDLLEVAKMPEQFVTTSVVKPRDAAVIANQHLLVSAAKGDLMLWSHFETMKETERLSKMILGKMRSVTIPADRVSAVGLWVRPNDHVDVLGTFKDPNSNDSFTLTVLQNVLVLATGRITGNTNVNLLTENDRQYNTVSLMVLPEEAEILALAQDLGKLSLSLRREDELDIVAGGRTTLGSLLSGERAALMRKQRDAIVPIIKGSTSQPQAPAPTP